MTRSVWFGLSMIVVLVALMFVAAGALDQLAYMLAGVEAERSARS